MLMSPEVELKIRLNDGLPMGNCSGTLPASGKCV